MVELRLVGGTLIERLTSRCHVGLHGGIMPNPTGDLLAHCRICGFKWRSSDCEKTGANR